MTKPDGFPTEIDKAGPKTAPDVPTGLQLCALDEAYRANPNAVMDILRMADPVHCDKHLNRYYVTRYEDVQTVLRSHEVLSNDPRNSSPDDFARLLMTEDYQPSMPMLDDPHHRRLRLLVGKAFNPRSIGAMAGQIQAIAEQLLTEAAQARELDIIDCFAAPLPTIVMAIMLGVPIEEQRTFKRWSDALFLKFDVTRDAATTARMNAAESDLRAYFRDAIAARRARPGQDLISDMVRAEEESARLTEDEIVQMCVVLLITGNVTTTDLIGNGAHALLTHPQQLEMLKADPELWPNAIEEILRYDSPVTDSGRIAVTEVDVGGVRVPKGRSVSTSLIAANYDPSVFADPHRFDITRRNIPHQSFGGGVHTCLGAPLARLEGRIALETLIRRFPGMQLADELPVRRSLPGFRGFQTLRVRI